MEEIITVYWEFLVFLLNPLYREKKYISCPGKNEVKLYSDFVRSSPPAKNVEQVLIPGDKEISTNKDRFKNGLPVAPLVWENIKSTAEKLNVPELDRFEKAIK